MIIPEIGSIRVLKMTGSKMATPETGPMPGSTPMAVPIKQPTSANSRFCGVSASWKPRASPLTGSTLAPQSPGIGRQLNLQHAEEERVAQRRPGHAEHRQRQAMSIIERDQEHDHHDGGRDHEADALQDQRVDADGPDHDADPGE